MSSRGEKVLVQFSQRGRYAKKTHERVFLNWWQTKLPPFRIRKYNHAKVYISVFWVKFLLFYNWWWYWGQNQALIPEFSLKWVLTAQLLGWEWNTGRWQQITRPISTLKTASCANISSMSSRKAKPSHCLSLGSDRCLLSILNGKTRLKTDLWYSNEAEGEVYELTSLCQLHAWLLLMLKSKCPHTKGYVFELMIKTRPGSSASLQALMILVSSVILTTKEVLRKDQLSCRHWGSTVWTSAWGN